MTARLDRLRAALSGLGCDSFFSFAPPSNEYLSGFRGTTSAIVVTPAEAVFLCDFRYTEQARDQVHGYEIREVDGNIETRAAELLTALGAQKTAFDATVLSVHQRDLITRAYHGELDSQPTLMAGLRMVKDASEIERLRAASALAEEVLADLIPDLVPGVQERQFAAKLIYELTRRGAQGPSFDPIVLFGERSSLPHGMPGERALKEGDIILIDFGCIRQSYCSDLTRTFAFGTIPGAWFEEIYQVTLQAQLAGLAALRAGTPSKDVDAASRNIISDAGYGDRFGHGLGHGVGLEIHEAPRLNKQSDAVLEAGMAVTVEPGIYLPGKGGVRIEDLVIVTEGGCEVLTKLPKELRVLGT